VVVRSFQLTRKPGGKYEFKALDQTISTMNEQGQVRRCVAGARARCASAHADARACAAAAA
jgi:hypothetical protein